MTLLAMVYLVHLKVEYSRVDMCALQIFSIIIFILVIKHLQLHLQ